MTIVMFVLYNRLLFHIQGSIDLEMTLLPRDRAVLMPVGLGREPPAPLPEPTYVY